MSSQGNVLFGRACVEKGYEPNYWALECLLTSETAYASTFCFYQLFLPALELLRFCLGRIVTGLLPRRFVYSTARAYAGLRKLP